MTFNKLAPANDGGFILLGEILNTSGPNANRLFKVDSMGNILWEKKIDEPGYYEFPNGKIIPVPDEYILSLRKVRSSSTKSDALRR